MGDNLPMRMSLKILFGEHKGGVRVARGAAVSNSSFLIRREYSSYVIMKFSSSAIQNNVMQVSLY